MTYLIYRVNLTPKFKNPKTFKMKKTFCIFLSMLALIALVATSAQARATNEGSDLHAQVTSASTDGGLDTTKVVSVPTDDEIRKMNIFDACKALGVNPEYNKRYDDIILPLCEAGVIMFPASSNPYGEAIYDSFDPVSGRPIYKHEDGRVLYMDCYYYVGTGAQNATLIRNMVVNKHLIKDGKLVAGAAKRWKVVK